MCLIVAACPLTDANGNMNNSAATVMTWSGGTVALGLGLVYCQALLSARRRIRNLNLP